MSLTKDRHCGAVLLVCLLAGARASSSEPPQLLWETTFGEGYEDHAEDVLQMEDGGLLAVGWTATKTGRKSDIYVVKTDIHGAMSWSRTYGDLYDDGAAAADLTADGGIVLAGWTTSFGAVNTDGYLLKLRADGTEEWSRLIGGDDIEFMSAVKQTEDGGYIFAGQRQPDNFPGGVGIYVVKTDDLGNPQWESFIGDLGRARTRDLALTPDGGCIIVGATAVGPAIIDNVDGVVVRLDAEGRTLWSRTIDRHGVDHLSAVVRTFDGGYAVVGDSGFTMGGGDYDVWLLRLDAVGNTLWSRSYGGASSDTGNAIVQTRDGGFFIAGFTASFEHAAGDIYVLKTDEAGNELWSFTRGGPQGDDVGDAVLQLDDGGYVVAGKSRAFADTGWGDMYLARFAPDVPLRRFIRGDANTSGRADIADAMAVVRFVFGSRVLSCVSAADVNDDDAVDAADAIVILTALFGTSADKPVLAAGCDFDVTGRDLGCEAFPPCE